MKKNVVIIIVALVIVFTGIILFFGVSDKSDPAMTKQKIESSVKKSGIPKQKKVKLKKDYDKNQLKKIMEIKKKKKKNAAKKESSTSKTETENIQKIQEPQK